MTINSKRLFTFTRKKMILCLAAWLVVCLIFYAIIHIWEDNRRKKIIEIGVSISKDLSSQSGFPLLEKNIERLSQLIETITKRPEVVFASIVDHKSKIIAYSDQDQFFTLNRQKPGVLDDVKYWRISNPNNQRVMTFSSEITFSDTRVGEVLISLATENIGQLKRVFVFFASFTLLVMGLLFGAAMFKDHLPWWSTLKELFSPSKKPALEGFGDSVISCPLCGNHEDFSLKGFQAPDLAKFTVLTQYSGTKSSVLLQDMEKTEELTWLKRVLITQCTKIINKIAAE